MGGDRKDHPLNTIHYKVESKLVCFYVHPRNKKALEGCLLAYFRLIDCEFLLR